MVFIEKVNETPRESSRTRKTTEAAVGCRLIAESERKQAKKLGEASKHEASNGAGRPPREMTVPTPQRTTESKSAE